MACFCEMLLILSICIATRTATAHVPMMRHYNWVYDEPPDSPIYVAEPKAVITRRQSVERLTALRRVLAANQVDAYIVPTVDAHNSQYIAATDARREWISGLSGSSGTAVATLSQALVWTDARYFTQFYMQVDTDLWQLMRQGVDLTIPAWLAQNLDPGSVVGVDPTTYTRASWNSLQATLRQANITLLATPSNLVDVARANTSDPAPARPNNPLIPLTVEFTGKRSSEKISDLLSQISSRRATALILTALDDIAYTLNLRGTDIPYNPVFFSYLVLRVDVQSPSNIILFWGNGTLSPEVEQHLTSEGTTLTVRRYEEIFEYVADMSVNSLPVGSTVWLSDDGSHAIHSAAEGNGTTNILSTLSPVVLVKCVKNDVELAGFRSAHVKDGTALVRFLRWIHQQVDAGANVTEVIASDKLEELRGEEEHNMGPSFATIAGAGENGAVIHYKPSREGPQRVITKDDMFLVDSGGQYKDGTTDVTRTRHMGAPTAMQKLAFTRVLKGQIGLATAVFPRGVVGHRLETLARKALWDVGLDYGHGTGHGVGHYLNVHEGPSWILSGPSATDPGIVEGMIFSNEPGYYAVDEYGIRHEDLVEVIRMSKDADHMLADGLVSDFNGAGALGFYTISLAPQQLACIDIDLLTDFEIKYLNDYHARVLSTIGPILLQRNLTEDYQWLEKECAPIERSGAFLFKSSPILVVGVLSVWFGL